MSQRLVVRRVWSNSASGYMRSIIRLFLGVISFRQVCTEFSTEKLGFYSLAWSFLGYGVLFDFGVGIAVQKRTSELVQRKDWIQLGRILSSVMAFNCVCAAVIVAVGCFATDTLFRTIGVSAENEADFRVAWVVFISGVGVMYPLQTFREVHYGQQRIAAADWASTVGGIISFVWLVVALQMHLRLSHILLGQVLCMVGTGVALATSALRAMPEVRLEVRDVSWHVLRSMARFSVQAYLVVFAGIVALQMDRLLVGAILSVSAVAIYHVGAKIPELFAAFTWQLPDAIAPAAATLHGQGKHTNWRHLFRNCLRLNALITTPLFALCFVFLEGLLGLVTRGRAIGPETILLGRVLLVWSYSTILTHGVSKAVFLMSGHETRLVRLAVIEAAANIALSFTLLQWLRSPLGAALGSLVPALVIGWLFLWPWAAREIGTTPLRLAGDALSPALRSSTPPLAFGVFCRFIVDMDAQTNLPVFLAAATVAAVLAIWGTWCFGLSTDERVLVANRMSGIRARMRQLRPWFS